MLVERRSQLRNQQGQLLICSLVVWLEEP